LRAPFSFNRNIPRHGHLNPLQSRRRGTFVLSQLDSRIFCKPIVLSETDSAPHDKTRSTGLYLPAVSNSTASRIDFPAISASKASPQYAFFYGARTASDCCPRKPRVSRIPSTCYRRWEFRLITAVSRGFSRISRGSRFPPGEIYSCGPLAMQYHVAKWRSQTELSHNYRWNLSWRAVLSLPRCAFPPIRKIPNRTFVHVVKTPHLFAGSIKWNRSQAQQTPPRPICSVRSSALEKIPS